MIVEPAPSCTLKTIDRTNFLVPSGNIQISRAFFQLILKNIVFIHNQYFISLSLSLYIYIDITLGQFIFVIRKRLQLKSEIAMYVYVNNKLMTTSDLLSVIDAKERDADGFLYLTYNGEWFFG